MDTFWAGFLVGGGTVVLLGVLCRAVLHANAERHFRAAYIATLPPEAYQQLLRFEASGVSTWRQFREREAAAKQQ